jgi:hypothetical protein
MNVRELIEQLTDLADEYGDDVDVRMANQPRWAFEYSIADVQAVVLTSSKRERLQGAEPKQAVIYLAEGSQLGYLPGAASVALGWSDADDVDDDEQEAGDDR